MNRCLTEGRKAFLARVAGIEAGSECERLAPLLSKLVDGEATADDLTALRPHIRTCLSCRAALREFRSAPATAAALVPATAFAVQPRPSFLELPTRAAEVVAGWAQKAQTATEMATAQKVAAVAASTAAIGGGAVVTVQQVERRADRANRIVHVERAKRAAPSPPPAATTAPTPAAAPPVAEPATPQLSPAARREREAKRKTPPAQQEFEPAWAAGEPTSSTSTATASTSMYEPAPSRAPAPTRSGGGAEEFAP